MEVRKLLLDDVAVIRKIPMSNRGCDNLRAAQRYLVDGLSKKMNAQVEIPFPMVIHMVLADFCKGKGIDVSDNGRNHAA